MGFTHYEKESLKLLIRDEKETDPIRDAELPTEALEYLRTSDLLHNVHDYALFPKKFFHRVNKAENIVLIKFWDSKMNVYDEIEKVVSYLTPTFRIQIDFGFLIINGHTREKQEFRYVFPQRSLALNNKIHINNEKDFETLLNEFKNLETSELTKRVFNLHQNQSTFEKSGFRPYCLLNMVFFLAKI